MFSRMALFVLFLGITLSAAVPQINVVVNANIDKVVTAQKWQPMIDYLNEKIPEYHFNLIAISPIDLPRLKAMIDDHQIHFVVTQPAIYVDLELNYGISRVMTMVKHGGYSKFGSVIITRHDSDITKLEGLKGKRIAGVAEMGFGGWLIGYKAMRDAGVDPLHDAAKVRFYGDQLLEIKAVLQGEADAAVIRTGILETYADDGKIDLEKIKVLSPRHYDDFDLIVSTELYPEWAFAKTRDAPTELVKQVVLQMLNLVPDCTIGRAAGFQEWTLPYDYKPVHDLMRTLQIGPYEGFEKVTISAFVQQHLRTLIILGILLMAVIVLTFKLSVSNRTLREEKVEKEKLLQKLREMATHDDLTGLANRILFMEFFIKMLRHSRRHQRPMALLFIDLDGFKAVNDRYGHKVGDEVLKRVSHDFAGLVRSEDIIARFGGDEFVIAIYPLDHESELQDLAERLVQKVAEVRHDYEDIDEFGASIGVLYGIPPEHLTPEEMIQMSDQLMYDVKENGKKGFLIHYFT